MNSNQDRSFDPVLVPPPSPPPAVGTTNAQALEEGALPLTLAARHVTARARHAAESIQDISLHVPAGKFITIAGPVGPARSLLLAVLAGLQPPQQGEVEIDGVSLYQYRKVYAPRLGIVQDAATSSPALTVFENLQASARLRLPRGTGAQEQRAEVFATMAALDLQELRDTPAGLLSPVQRWRLQIAMEWVARPSLLFLDEPFENLDPDAELALLGSLRKLARQSLTVIMVARSAKTIALSDRVVLLAPGGRLAWFGAPAKAIAYFKAFAPPPADSTDQFGFDDIYQLLANPRILAPHEWVERYLAQPAYQHYVDDPLFNKHPDLVLEKHPLTRLRGKAGDQPLPTVAQAGLLQQFAAHCAASFKGLLRDRRALALALGLPLLLAAVACLFVSRAMYDPVAGDATQATVATALLAFEAILAAAFAFSLEIVKEAGRRRRERQVNLGATPYVLAKLAVIVPLALYQALVWTAVLLLAANIPAGPAALPRLYVTLFIAAWVGGLLGLIASALADSAQAAIAWALVLVLPQLLLSGGTIPLQRLNPVGRAVAAVMPARYAFEALVTASGLGGDVAGDPCWALPAEQRNALTAAQRQGCRCTGDAAGSQCNFPGIRRFSLPLANGSAPAQPLPNSALSNVPVQPPLRSGETLAEYAQAVDAYTLQIEVYNNSASSYLNSLRQYLVAYDNWQRQNSLAAGSAVAVVAANIDAYGPIYNVDLAHDWRILLLMSLLLSGVLVAIQLRQGREPA